MPFFSNFINFSWDSQSRPCFPERVKSSYSAANFPVTPGNFLQEPFLPASPIFSGRVRRWGIGNNLFSACRPHGDRTAGEYRIMYPQRNMLDICFIFKDEKILLFYRYSGKFSVIHGFSGIIVLKKLDILLKRWYIFSMKNSGTILLNNRLCLPGLRLWCAAVSSLLMMV